MRKVLFVIPSFEIGGTTTSLKNLLPLIPRERYSIDIFPLTNTGDTAKAISKYATILAPQKSNDAEKGITISNKTYNFIILFVKVIKRNLYKCGIDISPLIFKKKARSLQKNKYDIVIAFQEEHPTSLVKYIQCPEKIAWVHSIFSRFSATGNKDTLINDYKLFDKIVCVSNVAALDMKEEAPILAKRIITVYNALDLSSIRNKSIEFEVEKEKTTIISIGRIDPVKRFSMIPSIACLLKKKGLNFVWLIIGGEADYNERKLLQDNINSEQVQDCVKWLGKKANPYPYLKNSDLLVCLSISETFNYTIAEAKALNIPIVTTDFPASREFVKNNTTGIIVPFEGISEAIYSLLSDKEKYKKIKSGIEHESNLNDVVSEQIKQIFTE